MGCDPDELTRREGESIMSKPIKLRSEARGGRHRASPKSAVANGNHPITLDVIVRLQAIALPEADGGFTVVIPALGCATEGDTIEEAQANAVVASVHACA